MPAKKLRGMLMTKAHGQLITKNVKALNIHCDHCGSTFNISETTGGTKGIYPCPHETLFQGRARKGRTRRRKGQRAARQTRRDSGKRKQKKTRPRIERIRREIGDIYG